MSGCHHTVSKTYGPAETKQHPHPRLDGVLPTGVSSLSHWSDYRRPGRYRCLATSFYVAIAWRCRHLVITGSWLPMVDRQRSGSQPRTAPSAVPEGTGSGRRIMRTSPSGSAPSSTHTPRSRCSTTCWHRSGTRTPSTPVQRHDRRTPRAAPRSQESVPQAGLSRWLRRSHTGACSRERPFSRIREEPASVRLIFDLQCHLF
jgi:hypothetical protein